MSRRDVRFLALIAALCLQSAAAARAADETALLLAGEPARDVRLRALGGHALVVADLSCVRVVARPGAEPGLRLEPPGAVQVRRHAGLRARVRATLPDGRQGEVKLRLYALDGARTVLFRRLVSLAAGEWTEVQEPFERFRWGSRVAARWDEVREVALLADGGATLDLADVRLTPGARGDASALPDPAWVERLVARVCAGDESGDDDPATPLAGVWARAADGIKLVGSGEAPGDEEAVARVLARLAHVGPWLARVAPEAVRPLEDGPIVLAFLPDVATYEAFFRALGRRWRVEIEPPEASGYAVQDVCAVAEVPERSLDRPVVLHEVVHAVAARRLRLMPGNDRHGWLQEALASYLQLALFPEAMQRGEWDGLRRELRDDPRAPFRPLAHVLAGEGQQDHYAQLASVVGFLLAERPGWLGPITRAAADGAPLEQALTPLGSSTAALEREWLAWARATLAGPAAPEGPVHFAAPEEWRATGGAPPARETERAPRR